MATVHLARVRGAGGFERLVALKVMHPHIASEPEFVQMFLDEARLAARIHHPNVVGTSDVQQDERGLFLVMEYIEGASLQVIQRETWNAGGRLAIDVALRIFLDALAGLHAAHEQTDANGEPLHLVHRDVSPQNILVGTDGVARLTDFGVARARTRLAQTEFGQLKGKLTYMAPEQVRSQPVDRRADVYSAGIVLWEILAGQRLMRGDSDAALVERILGGIKTSPRDVVASVPEPLSAACMRALAFDPEDRYPTAAAFGDAIEAAALEAGITIATSRGVSAVLRDLDSKGKLPVARALRAEYTTRPSPENAELCAADRPTVPERITPITRVTRSTRATRTSSGPASRATKDEAPRWTFTSIHGRRASRGMLVSAGVVLLASASIWLFSSMREDGDRLSSEGILAPTRTSLPSLDPPSVVTLPPAPSIEGAANEARARGGASPAPPLSEAARLKRSEGKTPMTSPPAFRPREL
jgi:eukaryotic-like serine/threonine-protein kinase